jgi:hypothetical protein
MAIVGQPFVACHHMSGMVKQAAMAAPPAAQRFRTSRDPPLKSAPRKIATAKKPMLCLLASPTPRTSPPSNQ